MVSLTQEFGYNRMRIRVEFDKNAALKEYETLQEAEKKGIISEMISYANSFMEDAVGQPEGHELGYYNNRTFQLRSSIGAYIFKDGELVWMQGSPENISLIEDAIPRGLMLVAMVGKDYASKVEAYGYNVISVYGDLLLLDLSSAFAARNISAKIRGNTLS